MEYTKAGFILNGKRYRIPELGREMKEEEAMHTKVERALDGSLYKEIIPSHNRKLEIKYSYIHAKHLEEINTILREENIFFYRSEIGGREKIFRAISEEIQKEVIVKYGRDDWYYSAKIKLFLQEL